MITLAVLTPFQTLTLIAIGVLFAGGLIALLRGWTGRREGVIWLVVWLVAGTAVLRPGLTSGIARFLGIGRGADLVLYSAVIVMLVGFWMVYIRLHRMRSVITALVREMALLEAESRLERGSSVSVPSETTRDATPSSSPADSSERA